MGIFVIKDAVVTINGVDLSDHCTQVEVNISAEDIDATTMVAAGQALGTVRRQGKRDDMFTMSFLSDFASSEVDATLWPLVNTGSVFPVTVKHTDAVTSATNPIYSGSCIMTSYQPIAGGVGDLATTDVDFPVTGVITRATA
jgi:hypothetical protein